MTAPYSRDRIEPRRLTATESHALSDLAHARQGIGNARAWAGFAASKLPPDHPAQVDLALLRDEAEWLIETYLAPAIAAIEELPAQEAQAAEDRMAEDGR